MSTTPTATIPAPTSRSTDLASLFTGVLSFSGLPDWALLLVLGTVIETLRRLASVTWQWLVDYMFIVAHFEGDDEAYGWMMLWLSRQPRWRTAREVQISTRQWSSVQGNNGLPSSSSARRSIGEDESQPLVERKRLSYLPSWGVTHTILYKHHIVRVTRDRATPENFTQQVQEKLKVSILTPTGNHAILDSLLLDAKKAFDAEEHGRINIYVAGSYNEWRRAGSRPKRPLESIVLDPTIKQMLVNDAREFLSSEAWYAERGIPYRRGYLLHGSPGSGKTSLIQSLAGVLELDIYIINLAKRGLDDSGLNELICDMPPHGIALIEEIDAAFHHSITREVTTQTATPSALPPDPTNPGVTLSGLLAAIDGVGAAEGRILFATTNKYHSLDPALTRPGRLDVHIKFELATRSQAEELFKCFYPATDAVNRPLDTLDTPAPTTPTAVDPDEKTPLAPTSSTSLNNLKGGFAIPKFSRTTIDLLASQFAAAIPEKEFSMAALQGFLMGYKTRPAQAAQETAPWVEEERRKRVEREKDFEGAKKDSDRTISTIESGPRSATMGEPIIAAGPPTQENAGEK